MPISRAGDVQLWYEEAGSGDPPILFVHGWTCDHTAFAPQFEYFRSTRRVIAVDLRGHGQSEVSDDGYDISQLAADVAALCRELELPKVVVVGHSMGALVAVGLAAAYPDLVAGVVMVASSLVDPPDDVRTSLGNVVDSIAGPDGVTNRRAFIEQSLFLPTDDPDVKARVVEGMLHVPEHVAQQCGRALVNWDGGASAMASIAVPVLAIHAESALNAFAEAQMSALCPSIRHEHTPGAGHFNQLLAPAEVNRLIEAFIEEEG